METEMNLKDNLNQTAESWAILGHPALLQRFVLRNGKAFTPTKRKGKKGTPKECFRNAANYVLHNGGTYVEGFAMDKEIGWPLHHAWVTFDGTDAMDPTLDAKDYEYFGVEFKNDLLRKETLRNGVYGLLDTGCGMNDELMFKLDPDLKKIVDDIKAKGNTLKDYAVEKLMEKTNDKPA